MSIRSGRFKRGFKALRILVEPAATEMIGFIGVQLGFYFGADG
jgi:hypothetical protein